MMRIQEKYCRYKKVFKDVFTKNANVYEDKLYNKLKYAKMEAVNFSISLLNITSKQFTKILYARRITWAKKHVCQEEQAGFRKGYNTTDQIFHLFSMSCKYLSKKKGRFCVGFIAFSRF